VMYGRVVVEMVKPHCFGVLTLVRYVANRDHERSFRFAWRASSTRCGAGSRV
jgi:hypothetical protein